MNGKRVNHRKVVRSHRKFISGNWSIDWDVQANQSNRLMVLTFHGLVLSDKVKGATANVLRVVAMVGVKKLNEMRVNPCRSVVNNFSIVKTDGLTVLRDRI